VFRQFRLLKRTSCLANMPPKQPQNLLIPVKTFRRFEIGGSFGKISF